MQQAQAVEMAQEGIRLDQMQVGVSMNGSVHGKQRVTLPPASSATSDGHGALPGEEEAPRCPDSTCTLVTLACAKTRRVGLVA